MPFRAHVGQARIAHVRAILEDGGVFAPGERGGRARPGTRTPIPPRSEAPGRGGARTRQPRSSRRSRRDGEGHSRVGLGRVERGLPPMIRFHWAWVTSYFPKKNGATPRVVQRSRRPPARSSRAIPSSNGPPGSEHEDHGGLLLELERAVDPVGVRKRTRAHVRELPELRARVPADRNEPELRHDAQAAVLSGSSPMSAIASIAARHRSAKSSTVRLPDRPRDVESLPRRPRASRRAGPGPRTSSSSAMSSREVLPLPRSSILSPAD